MTPSEGQFVKKYHKAVTRAVGDQLDRVKPRIASDWVKDWKEQLGGPVVDPVEFRGEFEDFLTQELGFAKDTKVTIEGDLLTIDIGGCMLCPANEILRGLGEPSHCPIISTGLMAISRVLEKKATLLDVKKEGPVGFCKIKYRLRPKN